MQSQVLFCLCVSFIAPFDSIAYRLNHAALFSSPCRHSPTPSCLSRQWMQERSWTARMATYRRGCSCSPTWRAMCRTRKITSNPTTVSIGWQPTRWCWCKAGGATTGNWWPTRHHGQQVWSLCRRLRTTCMFSAVYAGQPIVGASQTVWTAWMWKPISTMRRESISSETQRPTASATMPSVCQKWRGNIWIVNNRFGGFTGVGRRRAFYWNPDVRTDEQGRATVEFYNNSTCREMFLSVEGMSGTRILTYWPGNRAA